MMNNKFKYSSTSSKDSCYCTRQIDYLFMMDYSDDHFGRELISSEIFWHFKINKRQTYLVWNTSVFLVVGILAAAARTLIVKQGKLLHLPSSSIKPAFILFQPLHSIFIFNFITACFITSLKCEGLKNTFCNSGTTST